MFLHRRFLSSDIFSLFSYLHSLNMSSRKHKSRKRTRSRSPSSRRNSISAPDIQNESSPPKRRRDPEDDTLQWILHSIESLSGRLDSLESRSNQLESVTDTDIDVLSVMADDTSSLMEINDPLATEKSLETSSLPNGAPVEPIEASVEPIKAPVKPIKAPVEPVEAQQESSKTADEAANLDQCLFDPVVQSSSWKPSSPFSNFLESNFRRKLTYQQSLVILEDWATPEVDSLSAPKLDQQLLNQVPTKLKKFVQERDKEMFTIQRALLNATGPLCGLHDCIENGSAPSYEEMKLALEQPLCLLGSANTQLSILRRQRVLASTNKSRINLAELPLPNAKSWLFGDDFPSLASKQAELSRGLTRNLAQSTTKPFPRRGTSSQSQTRHRGDTFSKYQSSGYSNTSRFQSNHHGSRSKNGPYRPIGPSDPLNCFRVQENLFQNPFPKVFSVYPDIGSGGISNFTGSQRVVAERGHREDPLFKRRLLQLPVSVLKKDGPMRPVIDLSYLNKFILNEHFQMESLSCLKTLLLKGDFMTNIDLKDSYLSVPIHQSSQKFLRFIWEGTCYQFKALPFGLCSAPRIFTKLMKPVAAFLRRKSIRILIYLDDFLLLAATKEEAVRNTHLLVTLLQSLGFVVNFKKSSLIPSQVITFLTQRL